MVTFFKECMYYALRTMNCLREGGCNDQYVKAQTYVIIVIIIVAQGLETRAFKDLEALLLFCK